VPHRPPGLPDFDRPPVTEVVLSLQFGSLAKLKTAYVGFLWSLWRDRYPRVSEQTPLDPVFETFGTASPEQAHIRFEQLLALPFPRYWFETADGSELCQIQQNRIVHNWRLRGTPYPRYEKVRANLIEDLGTFEKFLVSEQLGDLLFNQSEITYINTIDVPGTDPHGALEQVLAVWKGMDSADRDLEDVAFRARYLMKKKGTPYARLHVSASPALRRATMAHVVQLELTFRGKPEDGDRVAALALLDEGREAIVKAFAEMTTPEMHEYWGRKDV
jgi:hypothetical protein